MARRFRGRKPHTVRYTPGVTQRSRFISVVGLKRDWKPTKEALAAFDPDMRVTPRALGRPGSYLLSFTSTAKAEEAFGKLFGDLALGLADALPDAATWIDGNMRGLARKLAKGS